MSTSGDIPYTTVKFQVRDSVAHITLDRPASYNALNIQLAQDMERAALQCQVDPAVRAVVLTGAGRAFCAGGDLKDFAARGRQLPSYIDDVTTSLHSAISHFVRMDAPVLAAVHGSAAGAGLSLVCACDLVLAAESARFSAAYTRLGLTPDGSLTYFLPRIVGPRRALELVLTNRTLTAREALDWGLVTMVRPDDELRTGVEELATRLASGPTGAFGATKRLMQTSWDTSLETQMALETRSIAEMTRGDNAREGLSAFLEKRSPRFS